MQAEPNRKAEEVLQAYARQRRQDASDVGELPLLTRNLLQSEIRKQFPAGSADKTGGLGSLRVFWLRLALGSSVLALVAFGFFLIINPPSKSQRKDLVVAAAHPSDERIAANNVSRLLRKKELSQRVEPEVSPLSGPPVSTTLQSTSETEKLAKNEIVLPQLMRDRSFASKDIQSRRGLDTLATSVVANQAYRTPYRLDELIASNRQIYYFAGQSEPSKEEKESLSADSTVRMLGAQNARAGINPLVKFSVETAGQQLRIIDSDGSIYMGKMDDMASSNNSRLTRYVTKTARPDGFFRVAGTNLTLQQNLTFEGTFNINSPSVGSMAKPQEARLEKIAAETKTIPRQAELHGVARIGTNETQINAISAPNQ